MSEVDRRWEGLLWRGFGIPDLIPPDRARAIVAERLGLELEGSEIPTSFRPEIATKLTDTFIRLAGDGQLDDVFLPTDLRSDRRDPEGVRRDLVEEIRWESGLHATSVTMERLRAAIELIFDTVGAYVSAHPFEDPAGRPFR